MNLFQVMIESFKFNKDKITMIELFAGIGSQHMAFKKDVECIGNLQQQFKFTLETIGISEIDKYAIASYNAIHGETYNFGSICDIQELPYCDILTYSFPCQDISLAGNQKGFTKGSGTRSGLLWEVERILEHQHKIGKLPQILLMENVKALAGKKFINDFTKWREKLKELGYSNYWEILNAKDYGIPQNRERVFMVSVLGEYSYTFPKPFPLKLRLKDMLEDEVDEKYYISEKAIAKIFRANNTKLITNDTKICPTIISQYFKIPRDSPFVYEPKGLYLDQLSKGIINSEKIFNISTTIKAQNGHNGIIKNGKIRKLTPKETWRLMGFEDESFYKTEQVCSNSQLYKQAGNSIVVDVLYYIFKELF